MSAMVVTEHVERLSDDEVWAILHGWPDLNDDDVDLCVTGGVGTSLIALECSGFQCATGDLRLLLCPVSEAYAALRAYLGEGIDELPAETPGRKGCAQFAPALPSCDSHSRIQRAEEPPLAQPVLLESHSACESFRVQRGKHLRKNVLS